MLALRFEGLLGPSVGLIGALCILAAAATVLALSRRPAAAHAGPVPHRRQDDPAIFLFEDGALIDTSPRAHALLGRLRGGDAPMARLTEAFGPVLPGLEAALTGPMVEDRLHLTGPARSAGSAPLRAEVEHLAGRTRLTLIEDDPDGESASHQTLALAAMEREMAMLRHVAAVTPDLVWATDGRGQITWANDAYMRLADACDEAERQAELLAEGRGPGDNRHILPVWPPRALFDAAGGADARRVRLTLPGRKKASVFDLARHPAGDGALHFAVDANALVAAEEQGRLFMQTITKTFAQLSIGLAIFDRDRRLSTFNPALMDLTGLGASFLTARPTLGAVLDRLRDSGVLQEPRNYRTWKQGLTALVHAARKGTYCETWTLPGGQVYRVTGRPHPDGAIAFLFEDISAEVSLTRNFRAEIETAQAVLDGLDDAIAVFSSAGTLTTCNAAFDSGWGAGLGGGAGAGGGAGQDADSVAAVSPGPGDGGLDPATLSRAVAEWQGRAGPAEAWERVRRAASVQEGRRAVSEVLSLPGGGTVTCRVVPLTGGSTMLRFSQGVDDTPPALPAPMRAAPARLTGLVRGLAEDGDGWIGARPDGPAAVRRPRPRRPDAGDGDAGRHETPGGKPA